MDIPGTVTFASDFGTREYYVGAVKGAILSVNPTACIVDTSHEIGAHDVLAASFTILGYYSTFPARTIHLIVVDPGVGSNRRGIVVQTERHFFVAPDNGVLSLVFQREKVIRVISIEAEHYFRRPVSATFHGRDIFGPVTGQLSKGIDPAKFGPEITDFKKLSLSEPKDPGDGLLHGFALHIDRFGNIVTNFSEEFIAGMGGFKESSQFIIEGQSINRRVTTYSDASQNELFTLVGSCGFYELAANQNSAARLLGVKRGAKVTLRL